MLIMLFLSQNYK